jgi:glyceraldehyde 3-phosphate dehydrogenase
MLNGIYRKASENDPEHLVVYSEEQNVSTDLIGVDAAIVIEGQFNHTRTAFIEIDLSHVPNLPTEFLKTLSQSTMRLPVVHAKIFGWYDNEYGSYTNRMGDLTVYVHKSLFQ